MAETHWITAEAVRLLQEAAEWRLLGLLFEYPSGSWRANMESLIPSLPRPGLRALARAGLSQSSEGLHSALFGPAGAVPVREVAWRSGLQFGYLMAELSACYAAFGYEPRIQEAADHLAIQLGFVAFLKMKHALALTGDDPGRAQVTAAAIEEFLREHIATQAEPVLHKLERFAPPYLAHAGRLILRYAGPRPRSTYPLTSDLIGDGEEIRCGPPLPDAGLIHLEP